MRFFSSLFWRLYVTIIGAFMLVGIVFFYVIVHFETVTVTDRFYVDVTRVLYPVIDRWEEEQSVSPELMETLERRYFLNISILGSSDYHGQVKDFDLLRERDNVIIFGREGEQDGADVLLAAQLLPDSDMWLVISDDYDVQEISPGTLENMDSEFALQEAEDVIFGRIFLFTLAGFFLLIGLAVLYRVREIGQYIEGLIDTSVMWGQGELHEKVNEKTPSPLNQLARSLNEMAGNLLQSNKEQQVMMHAVSHELRTPLSKLELALSLLRKKYETLDGDPIIDNLSSYVDELNELTNQVLKYSKLRHRATGHCYEDLDFSELILERSGQLEKLHDTKNITYDVANNLIVRGERFYIQMLLDNLISNALKFSKSVVQVTAIQGQECIYLKISDDGPGIPVDLREKAFLPFFRVDESRTKDTGGFGLGLAIAEVIVHQHRGNIELADSQIGGLAVNITLRSSITEKIK